MFMKRSISIVAAISLVAILNVSCGEEAPVKAKPVNTADSYVEPTTPANDGSDFLDTPAVTDPNATASTDTGGGLGGFADILSGLGGGASSGAGATDGGFLSKIMGFFSSFGGGNGLGDAVGG